MRSTWGGGEGRNSARVASCISSRAWAASSSRRPRSRSFEVGEVTAWDPPAHLRLDWRIRNFAPGEKTEVEIWFEASPSGTRVTVEHRGWDGLRADHPARHGLAGRALSHMIGLWWGIC